MKRKRFSVEQIVAVLKQAELGLPVCNDDVDGLSSAASSAKVWSQERHGEGDRP